MRLDPQRTVDLLVNILKNIEEVIYQNDKPVVLPNFPRTLQLDGWTCGARSVYSVLRYFGKRCTVKSVENDLRTDFSGTDVSDIIRVFQKHHLKASERKHCRLYDLRNAIDDGNPVLVSVDDGSHYSVVFGYSKSCFYVMNPAIIGSSGSLICRIVKRDFSDSFDHWGIIVSD